MSTQVKSCLLVYLILASSSARSVDLIELKDSTVTKAIASDDILHDRTITVGAGYSGDSQQVTEQQCFKATISSISEKEGKIKLDGAVSFSELENELKTQVSVGGKFPMFSTNAKASYLRAIQDKDYSFSLNYYASFAHKVTLNIEDYGIEALTKFGKGAYNDGNNHYFGLVCGDHYVASYDQGALLTMGLNVQLNSHEDKRDFQSKAKVNYGSFNLYKAAGSIGKTCKEETVSASVKLHAYQSGGDPTKLLHIMSSNVVTCNVTDMEPCLKTARELLDYAQNFGNQIQNNTGFEPLGTATYHPIKWIGLTPPPSLVTKEVAQYRKELARIFKESEYYTDKLYSLSKGYPVQLDTAFVDKANLILAKADNNMRVLMNPESGAAGCFNEPDRCQEIKDDILSQLQNISEVDLQFMKRMKYTVPVPFGDFYNTGAESGNSWSFILKNPENYITVESAYITDNYCAYALSTQSFNAGVRIIYEGTWNDNVQGYVGNQTRLENGKNSVKEVTHQRQISSFFF